MAVGSKEGMMTKLTRGLRRVEPREPQQHSLAAGSNDTGETKAVQKIQQDRGCPWYFRS